MYIINCVILLHVIIFSKKIKSLLFLLQSTQELRKYSDLKKKKPGKVVFLTCSILLKPIVCIALIYSCQFNIGMSGKEN